MISVETLKLFSTNTSDDKELLNELYYLMHRDTIVALLSFNRITGEITSVVDVFVSEELPVGYSSDIVQIRKWWVQRAIPVSREGLKHLLIITNEITSTALLLAGKGLSLTDHYWMKHVNSLEDWNTVNYYTNDFTDDIGDILFGNKYTEDVVSKLSPSSSAVGEMKKKWIIRNGVRYLLKVNLNDYSQQCVNEIIASKLHETLNFENYVKYSLINVPLNDRPALGCICKAFTSTEQEFISAFQLIQTAGTKNDASCYELMLELAELAGLNKPAVRNHFEYTMVTDFLLTNTDRHFNNFGFLRKKDCINLTGIAPIFDTGNSLFYNQHYLPIGEGLYDINVTTFWDKETKGFKYIKPTFNFNTSVLSSFDQIIYNLLSNCNGMPDDRKIKIVETFKVKLTILNDFLNGSKIWKGAKYR